MKTQWFAASAVLALAVGLSGASALWAKPADLPTPNGIECAGGSDGPAQSKFQIELDITPNGVTFKWGAEARPEPPPSLDALTPAFVEQMLVHLGDMLARPDRFVSLDALLARLPCFDTASIDGTSAADAKRRQRAEAARETLEMRLFEPVNVRIKNVPLKQAIKNLARASGIRIVPDYAALDNAKVNLNYPVSLEVENTSVHTALQQLLHPLRLDFTIENDTVMITTPDSGSHGPAERAAERRNLEAQRLFEIAERLRRSHDYDVARRLYQQVHQLTPATLQGRMAIVRIIDIEERMRDESEEQGGELPGRCDDPKQVFRDMRERTIPLGLVR